MLHARSRIEMEDYFQNRTTKWEDMHDGHNCSRPTQNPLLLFCDLILKYEKYKPYQEEMDNSPFSPSGSERTSDSFSSENDSFNDGRYSGDERKVSENESDSWDLVTCHCMKPFKGRPMIECNVCGTWVHMSCAKIRPNNVPDIFACQFCREPNKSSKRRSERIRSDDRRLLSA